MKTSLLGFLMALASNYDVIAKKSEKEGRMSIGDLGGAQYQIDDTAASISGATSILRCGCWITGGKWFMNDGIEGHMPGCLNNVDQLHHTMRVPLGSMKEKVVRGVEKELSSTSIDRR